MKKMQIQQQKTSEEPFVFTKENIEKVQYHIAKYPKGRQASAVLPLLDIAQRQSNGWLPRSAIETVAGILEMPVIRVFEVANFYTMFNLNPVGKYHLQLCGTTPCWLRGAEKLKERCQDILGIKEGEVTVDGKFSLIEVECLGTCVNAPVVQINDDFFEDLTPEQFEKVLNDLADDQPCQPGSQIGRQCSAPEGYSSNEKPSAAKQISSKGKAKPNKDTADAS